MTGFYRSVSPFFLKSLPIHFNPSQNVSPILLLNGLMMVTNEGSIANVSKNEIFAIILRISSVFGIFQISLAIKNH